MSVFARSFYDPEPSFVPLFRLLEDFDSYSRDNLGNNQAPHHRRGVRTFSPKFDVRETETGYELHGELPGLERENVSIDFTDPQTIVIRGRVERSYTAGTPPAGAIEGHHESKGAITEGTSAGTEAGTTTGSHKVTVEDEPEGKGRTEKDTTAKNGETSTEVSKREPQRERHGHGPAEKFWVSERSVGEFSRTFSFGTRVDQDAVSANLKNGILTILVPKAKKHESRRIAID